MKFYSIFHLNLMFSSIREDQRSEVIKKCYWPLLKLCENNYKIGIELTGNSLEIINTLDKKWVNKFKSLLKSNKVELIGSGYSQIIGPLVPSKLNDWNQKLGIEVYKSLLDTVPSTALINEMSYSSGILEHYVNNGYSSIIMEINNSLEIYKEWILNRPNIVENQIGDSLNIIWADSIAFQKFQRYISDEIDYESYVNYLNNYNHDVIPLYTSDAEIFDFRPGRFKEETNLSESPLEWNKIEKLYESLKSLGHNYILPRDVKLESNEKNKCSIESASKPIVVKKQNKYNINRWALSGRDDLNLNTKSIQIFNKIKNTSLKKHWKSLCFIWSSDFRTHITDDRWIELEIYIEKLFNELNLSINHESKFNLENFNTYKNNKRFISVLKNNFNVELDTKKGNTIKSLFSNKYKLTLIGKIDHGFFEEITYGFDYFTGHSIVERLGERKVTDLESNKVKFYQNNEITSFVNYSKKPEYTINSKITISDECLLLEKQIISTQREKTIISPFNFTFIPDSWDDKTLFFSTHNGGSKLETFFLNESFDHSERHSYLISSINGIGNTKGMLIVGDKNKSIKFQLNLSKSFLIPTISFNRTNNSFLLRVSYSAQELDETFRVNSNPQIINSEIIISIN